MNQRTIEPAEKAMAGGRQQKERFEENGWLQALLHIAQSAMAMPRDELLREVAGLARDLLGAAVSIVWSLDRSHKEFRVVAWSGDVDEAYRTKVTFGVRAEATERFLKERRPLYLSDVADPEKAPFYTQEHRAEAQKRGWVSLLSAPMIAENQVVGILDVYTGQMRRFPPEDRTLLNTFASQAALAARRAAIEEERAHILDRLQEISALSLVSRTETGVDVERQFAEKVVEAVHDLTGDDVALWLPDETAQQWQIRAYVGLRKDHVRSARVGLGDSISGKAMRTRKPIALFDIFDPDNQPPFKYLKEARNVGWRSVLSVPLLTPEQALGTLSVYSHTQRVFAQWEKDLLTTFSNQAAVAFESIRRRQSLEDLVNIGETLTRETAAGLGPVLEKAARSARELVGADYAVVYPYDPDRRLFYDSDHVAVDGLKPRSLTEKPRERGLAAIVRVIDELVVHDVTEGKLGTVDFGRIKEPGIDQTQLLRYIREEKFIQEESVKAFVGLSLKAGSAGDGTEQEVGVLYIDFCRPHHFAEEELDLLRIFGHQVGSAIQNARLLEKERRLRQQAETLREVSSAISRELKLKEAAEKVFDELAKVVGYRKASLQLIRGNIRTLIAGRGFDTQVVNEVLLRPISQDPLIDRVVTRKRPLILRDTSKEPDWEIRSDTADIRSWVGLPLIYGDETIGLLTLDHNQPGYYTEAIEDLMALFGGQAAIAIQNGRLFEDAQRRIRDLEILNDAAQIIGTKLDTQELLSTIAHQIVSRLECTHCTIFFPQEEEGQTLLVPQVTCGLFSDQIMSRRFKLDEGLVGWVFQHGESLVLANAKDDPRFAPATVERALPRSMLVAPIKVGARTIGVISSDQDKYGWFSENDRRLVDALAQHVGIAIGRAEALKLLQNTSAQISAALSVEEILGMIMKGAIRLTGTESGVIHLVDEDEPVGIHSYEFPKGFGHPTSRFSQKRGLTWTIVSNGQITAISDISDDRRVNPEMVEKGVKAIIGVPLTVEAEIIGALFLNHSQPHEFTEYERYLLSALASHAAIAIRNARLYEQRARDISALIEVNRAIPSRRPDKITQLIADKAIESMGADYSVLRLVGGSGQYLESIASSGRKRRKKAALPIDEMSFTGWVAMQRKAALSPDVRKAEHYLKWYADVKSCMAAPLLYQERLIGTLYVESTRLNAFSEESQLTLLQSFADQAAIAIENAGLYGRLTQLQKVTAIISAGSSDLDKVLRLIVDSLSQIFPGGSCAIRLYDAKRDRFGQRVAAGILQDRVDYPPRPDGTSRYVAKTKTPLFVADVEEGTSRGRPSVRDEVIELGVKAAYYLPLICERQVIGVLYLDLTDPSQLTENDRQILELFANQAAIAIEDARLFQELLDRSARLTRLQEITAAISAQSHDLDKLLDLIANSLREVFQAASCVIRLYDSNTDKFGRWVVTGVSEDQVSALPRPNGTSRFVVTSQRPRYIEDTTADPTDGGPAVSRNIVDQGVRAAAQLPLISKSNVVGVLYVNLETPRQFSAYDQQILELFADQAAIAIENARLFREAENRARQLVRLQEVTATISAEPSDLERVLQLIVDSLVDVFPGASSGIRPYDAELDRFGKRVAAGPLGEREDRAPRAAGTSRYAIRTATPLFFQDTSVVPLDGVPSVRADAVELGVRANACLPLLSQGEARGVLYVDLPETRQFSKNDRQVLQLFADQAAIAIENARLFEELDERATHLEQLYAQRAQDIAALEEINEAVVSKGRNEVLRLVVEKAVSVMPGEYGELWLREPKTGDLMLEAAHGPAEATARKIGRIKAGAASINMRVAESGEYIICENVKDECDFFRIYKEAQSSVTVSLKYQGAVIGTLNVESSSLAAFGNQHARLLDSFADQAAIAIENARLFERIQELRVLELETFSQLGEELSAIEQEF